MILTLTQAWIHNYIHYEVLDEITYPFLNFNGFIPHFIMDVITYSCWDYLSHVSKRGPWCSSTDKCYAICRLSDGNGCSHIHIIQYLCKLYPIKHVHGSVVIWFMFTLSPWIHLIYHIEAGNKWLPFSRLHFWMHFLDRKCLNFYQDFTEVCS